MKTLWSGYQIWISGKMYTFSCRTIYLIFIKRFRYFIWWNLWLLCQTLFIGSYLNILLFWLKLHILHSVPWWFPSSLLFDFFMVIIIFSSFASHNRFSSALDLVASYWLYAFSLNWRGEVNTNMEYMCLVISKPFHPDLQSLAEDCQCCSQSWYLCWRGTC